METAAEATGAPDSCRLRLIEATDGDGVVEEGPPAAAEGIPKGACRNG